MTLCKFINGEPANLEAAALDALPWLKALKRRMESTRYADNDHAGIREAINLSHLNRCIAALERQLGDYEIEHEQPKEPS